MQALQEEEEKEACRKEEEVRWERQGSPARGEEETGLQLGEERVRDRQAGREVHPPQSTGQRPRGQAWR